MPIDDGPWMDASARACGFVITVLSMWRLTESEAEAHQVAGVMAGRSCRRGSDQSKAQALLRGFLPATLPQNSRYILRRELSTRVHVRTSTYRTRIFLVRVVHNFERLNYRYGY